MLTGTPAPGVLDAIRSQIVGPVTSRSNVNIAARLESIAAPGAICLSEQAYWQVKGRLDLAVTDLGQTQLKNIAEPIRVYSLRVGVLAQAKPAMPTGPPAPKKRPALAPLQRSSRCSS